MFVTRTTLPIQSAEWSTDPTHFVHVLSNLLSNAECEEIIKSHRNLVPSAPTIGTIRAREQFDDPALAAKLWSRISHFYKDDRVKDEDGYWWRCKGLNIHMRLSKYDSGGRFTAHFDYRRMASLNEQSFMSLNVYLNTVPKENKGATQILRRQENFRVGQHMGLEILGQVQPVQGTASVFRETVWHDGEELVAGDKYLLRSDIMYEREGDFDFERTCKGLSGTEKANKALKIFYALEEGGNFSEADVWCATATELSFFI